MADQAAIRGVTFSAGLQWLLSTACGLLIANVYFGQPLAGLIGHAIGLPTDNAGLIVTLPLAGYGLGLLLVVPLADLFENRRLVLLLVAVEALSCFLLSFLSGRLPFLATALIVGAMAAAVQILVPYVTYIAPVALRGQAVGKVVSGVMLGIMLARPVASFVTDYWGWQAIYRISALLMALLWLALRRALPPRVPQANLRYSRLLASMWSILNSTEILRRRAFYHGCMFGAFSVFWTAVPLWLSSPVFGLTQQGIALVALAGVAGAVAPPIAGRLGDKGHSQLGTAVAMGLAAGAFLLSNLARGGTPLAVGLVTAAAILLDFSVSAHLVFSQRAIYSLGEAERSRINGLFMALFFIGGSTGSAISGWAYSHYGWTGVSAAGVAFPLAAFAGFLTEKKI
jgi:predicted MFS family arabinose efflux permease